MVGERFKRPPRRRVTESHESRRAEPKAQTTPSVGLPQRSSERAFYHERESSRFPKIGRSVVGALSNGPQPIVNYPPVRASIVHRARECDPEADCRQRSTTASRSTVKSVYPRKVHPLKKTAEQYPPVARTTLYAPLLEETWHGYQECGPVSRNHDSGSAGPGKAKYIFTNEQTRRRTSDCLPFPAISQPGTLSVCT